MCHSRRLIGCFCWTITGALTAGLVFWVAVRLADDLIFFPAQPSIPPFGTRIEGQNIYWGVALIWVSNRTDGALLLTEAVMNRDRPNDPGSRAYPTRIPPLETTGRPWGWQAFLQAGTTYGRLRLQRGEDGEILEVALSVQVEPGMECDLDIEVRQDSITALPCRTRGRYSISGM